MEIAVGFDKTFRRQADSASMSRSMTPMMCEAHHPRYDRLLRLADHIGGGLVISAVRPALRHDLCAREEADAVVAILVKVAKS